MDLSYLEKILAGEPKYRLKQAKEAIFKHLAENWSEASGLPAELRARLTKECPLDIAGEILESSGNAEVLKAMITLSDGLKVESVLMMHAPASAKASAGKAERVTVCVSSQVGCPLGCRFCATGAMGFRRNLTAGEIVEQVLFFARYLKRHGRRRVTNVVFMGMGEPFLNYDNVMAAVKILNDKDGLNIGARKISISTSGIIEGIEKLAEEKLQLNLAISLHAADDKLRSELMPINRKYPLADVLRAVDAYIKKTSRQVMFEYILLKDINDSEGDAQKLARLMRGKLHFVNLIVYNPIGKKGLEPSESAAVKKFKAVLEKEGVHFSERYRFGRDIKAACGQLATRIR